MVEITSVSKHGRTKYGSSTPNGQTLGTTNVNHSQYSIAYGKGSNRQSMTLHGSKQMADSKVAELKAQGH